MGACIYIDSQILRYCSSPGLTLNFKETICIVYMTIRTCCWSMSI